MKNKILNILKVLLSLITIPMWFIKMFVGIGHLPDRETGEIVEVIFRHSMYENVCNDAHPFIIYVCVAVTSVVLNALNLKMRNKQLSVASNIAFGVATGLFVIMLMFASSVARGY